MRLTSLDYLSDEAKTFIQEGSCSSMRERELLMAPAVQRAGCRTGLVIAVAVTCTAGCAASALGVVRLAVNRRGSKTDAKPRLLEDKLVDSWRLPPGFDGDLDNLRYGLKKRYDLTRPPEEEFEVQHFKDEGLTNSCAKYVDDGSTVFARNGKLVLKVADECEDGKCLKSGRIMSRASYKYGIFSWSVRLPKCHALWPALWLLPGSKTGVGRYGQWPCSGEIDVMETIDSLNSSGFNVITGYGSSKMGCAAKDKNITLVCDKCAEDYCMSTTLGKPHMGSNSIFVEGLNCSAHENEHHSWTEHRFVFRWQPGSLVTWVDPDISYSKDGDIIAIKAKKLTSVAGYPSWKSYEYQSTPTWLAAEEYMGTCFPGSAALGAPFDKPMRLMLNLAVGGYGGAPCVWGSDDCANPDVCGKAVGAEMIVSDISVWQSAGMCAFSFPLAAMAAYMSIAWSCFLV